MCVLMVGVLLYLARALILPLLCAFAVGLTLGPVIKVAERRGVPAWMMRVVLVVLLIAATNLAIVILAGPVSDLVARAPEIGAAFAAKLHIFDRPLAVAQRTSRPRSGSTRPTDLEFRSARISSKASSPPSRRPRCNSSSRRAVFRHAVLLHPRAAPASASHAINWFSDRDARLRALKILNDIEEQSRRLPDRGDGDQPRARRRHHGHGLC